MWLMKQYLGIWDLGFSMRKCDPKFNLLITKHAIGRMQYVAKSGTRERETI